jgi:peptidoglycan/xylan/chitin deacetylase (PgdA/CDA1 family)
MTANYLIRFDDICPTMNWTVWQPVEEVLVAADIKPILAVVADNQDDVLKVNPPDECFWDRVRTWRDRGWTVALHGYQHRYVTSGSSMVGRRKSSEFAGLLANEQEVKLERALAIFRREFVQPDVWVAPGHSFDRTTVNILREKGLRRISDGPFLFPNVDSTGMLWIPQQLWRFPFRPMPFGVWTVCLHVNHWTPSDILEFRRDVERYRKHIVTLQQVITLYGNRRRDWKDKLFEVAYPAFLCGHAVLRSWLAHIAPQALAFASARRQHVASARWPKTQKQR